MRRQRVILKDMEAAREPGPKGTIYWGAVASLHMRWESLEAKVNAVRLEIREWEEAQRLTRLAEAPKTPEQRHLANVADAELCDVRDCEPYVRRWADLLDLELTVEDGEPKLARRDKGLRLVEG